MGGTEGRPVAAAGKIFHKLGPYPTMASSRQQILEVASWVPWGIHTTLCGTGILVILLTLWPGSLDAVTSAQEDRDVMAACLQLGAADYMIKPLRHNELRNLWARVYWWRRVRSPPAG